MTIKMCIMLCILLPIIIMFVFFFNVTATTEIYTLSLHDALPIWIAHIAGPLSTTTGAERAAGYRDALKAHRIDRKSTRLNSSHVEISYAVFCLKKKTITIKNVVR